HRLLRRPYSTRRKTGRFTVSAADQISAHDQSADCQGDDARYPCDRAGSRRRGDRVNTTLHRRSFLTLLGTSAAAWPLAARAQQDGRVRRVGVLTPGDESDPEVKRRLSAFTQALADLGWTDGRNILMDLRWAGSDANRIRALAQELVGPQPDIIVTNTTAATA